MSVHIQPEEGGSFEYIRDGAIMKCILGSLPCKLKASPKRTYFAGDVVCTEIDKVPAINGIRFGMCASAKAPCAGVCAPIKWMNVKEDTIVEGRKPLLDRSNLPCALGGNITFITSGQR